MKDNIGVVNSLANEIDNKYVFSETKEDLKEKIEFVKGLTIVETVNIDGEIFNKFELVIDNIIKGQFYLKKGKSPKKENLIFRRVSKLQKLGNYLLYIGEDRFSSDNKNTNILMFYGQKYKGVGFYKITNIKLEKNEIIYDGIAHDYDGCEGRTYGAKFEGIKYQKGFNYIPDDLPRRNTRGNNGPQVVNADEYMKERLQKEKMKMNLIKPGLNRLERYFGRN